MADWSMTVEVAGESDGAVSFRAVHADDARPHGATDPAAGVVTAGPPGRVADAGAPHDSAPHDSAPHDSAPHDSAPHGSASDGGDRVDALAAALTALLDRVGRAEPPVRLAVVVDGDADRRDFVDLDEAAALAGLPAPMWVPEPIAVAGHRLAARLEPGDAAVVLDARGTTLTAWPLERTEAGVVVSARGPVAVTDRIDELLVGVVRATGRAATGNGTVGAGGPAGSRRADAERRREVRRARRRLAATLGLDEAGVDEVGVDEVPDRAPAERRAADDGTGLDVAVFEQAVTSALGDVMDALAGDRRVAVEVVADGRTVLAHAICDLIGAQPVVPTSSDAAVLGAAGLALGILDEDPPADVDDLADPDPVDEDRTDVPPVHEDRTDVPPVHEDRTDVPPVHEDRTDVQPVHEDPRDEGESDGEDTGEDHTGGGRTDRDHVLPGRAVAASDDAGPEPDESPTSEDVFGGPSPAWTPPGTGHREDDRDGAGRSAAALPAGTSSAGTAPAAASPAGASPAAMSPAGTSAVAASPATGGSTAGPGGVRSWAVGSLAVSIVMIAATAALVLTGGSTAETSAPVVGSGVVALG